jgi:hypothetical protein
LCNLNAYHIKLIYIYIYFLLTFIYESIFYKKKNLILQQGAVTLLSGECDFLFKIRLLGIDNLQQIFLEDNESIRLEKRPTFNGLVTPKYITK